MLIKYNDNRQSQIMVSYLKESFEHATMDCHYRLKPDFPSLGLRYLHYYEQDHTLIMANIHHGKVYLLNLLTGNFRSFLVHNQSVRKVRMFNGEIYTSSWDGSVCATNYYTLKNRIRFTDRTMGRCPFFNINPEGTYLYSFSYDSDIIPLSMANSVRKWNMKTGNLEHLMAASTEQKSGRRSGSIIFYKNRLYVSCNSGYFRIFDQKTGGLIREIHGNADYRSMMALFHHNYLLASDWDGYIHFLNLKTNRIDFVLKCHNTDILSMRIHPYDRDVIFTSSYDGVIKVWKMPGFVLLNTIITAHTDLWSMVFINDRLVIGNVDGEISVYDIKDLLSIKFLGRLVLSDKAIVAQAMGVKQFYTNNPSAMEVYREDEGVIEGKDAEYLADQGNNLMVLRDLFGIEEADGDIHGNKWGFTPLLGAHGIL